MRKIMVETAIQVETSLPEVVDAIQRHRGGTIVLAFEDFADQAALFHDCVWYALSKGKQVIVRAEA
jgi:hypothetical protein